ncbi:rhamnosyltransferase WsaF family glycosyltransferase [Photorhabdus kayaii]|uniref:rhamnosyltransferase WsaF family glycosyltransferase n=1 Tax=Photorhabdus kayaii TaxID=230088 RepID=UPI0021D4EC47|nr:glycosyl transferase family 1 [Photorhabdus kayaii]MCT8351853.1 glycosyl transferase family 1 [Photorhabdus kayaii]
MANIAWFIPQLIEGSGGHRTMLQHAAHLEKMGHNCTIYLEDKSEKVSGSEVINKLFGLQFTNVIYDWNNAQPCDAAVATIWYSASFVAALPFDCKRFYFVQDFEAYFNPVGDAFLMAENSYCYGLTPITIGRWLRHKLKNDFSVESYHFEFGANTNIYKHMPTIKKEKAVCFIYQPDKPRRCSRIGIEALGIVKHCMPDVKIYLYGSSIKDNLWFEHEHLGLLDLNKCNELYNKCSAGLCISSSNPSRIPFEMMNAGLPVIEVWRENNLYDFSEDAMLLCKQTPESIAAGVMKVLNDQELSDKMSKAGQAFMNGRSLEAETEGFYAAFNAVMNEQIPPAEIIARSYLSPAFEAPIIRSDIANKLTFSHQSLLKRIALRLPLFIRTLLQAIYFKLKK